jgi:hypothetical protein
VSVLHGPVLYHGRRKHTPPDEPEGYGVLDATGYTFYERDGSVWTAPFSDEEIPVWWDGAPSPSSDPHMAAEQWIRDQKASA